MTSKTSSTLQRWKIMIEHNGSQYRGWQRQPDVPTIQNAIENALYKFCQQEIQVQSAGRTDAGVHARGQVAHFDLDYGDRTLSGFDLAKAMNAHLLPQHIAILHAEKVSQDFHARYSAINKLYQYRMIVRPGFLSLDEGFAWHIRRPFGETLDVNAMQGAANILLGHHDFSTFRDAECQAKSPMKTLDRLEILSMPHDAFGALDIRIEAEGKSFLHHQVRNMVGTLKLVGEGKWNIENMKTVLEAKDRTKGGPTAPAHGLYLMRVDY